MTLEGVDALYPPGGAELRAAQKAFVGAYLKNMTAGQVLDWQQNRIAIVALAEGTGQEYLGGQAAGVAQARQEDARATAVGLGGCPIFFCVDQDTADTALTNAYFQGALSVVGFSRMGGYGCYAVVKAGMEAGTLRFGFQTYAWSGGQLYPACHLYQYLNGQTLAGHGVDLGRTVVSDTEYGQYGAPAPPPPPPPPTPSDEETELLSFDLAAKGIRFIPGPDQNTSWNAVALEGDTTIEVFVYNLQGQVLGADGPLPLSGNQPGVKGPNQQYGSASRHTNAPCTLGFVVGAGGPATISIHGL